MRTISPNSVCQPLHIRKERLARILHEQIMIANKLTVHRSKYNRESVIAWDIVEELSAELKNINTRLDMCLCEEEAFLMNEEHENDLATREYDI